MAVEWDKKKKDMTPGRRWVREHKHEAKDHPRLRAPTSQTPGKIYSFFSSLENCSFCERQRGQMFAVFFSF